MSEVLTWLLAEVNAAAGPVPMSGLSEEGGALLDVTDRLGHLALVPAAQLVLCREIDCEECSAGKVKWKLT